MREGERKRERKRERRRERKREKEREREREREQERPMLSCMHTHNYNKFVIVCYILANLKL